jgi:hypothetical protein
MSAHLDRVNAVLIKQLIARGRSRGYVTREELNAILGGHAVTSKQIEETMAQISELGITVRDEEHPTHPPDIKCAFCGVAAPEISREMFIAGPTAFICRFCVEICVTCFSEQDAEWRRKIILAGC